MVGLCPVLGRQSVNFSYLGGSVKVRHSSWWALTCAVEQTLNIPIVLSPNLSQ